MGNLGETYEPEEQPIDDVRIVNTRVTNVSIAPRSRRVPGPDSYVTLIFDICQLLKYKRCDLPALNWRNTLIKPRLFIQTMITLASASLGLVAALAWNEAIKAAIKEGKLLSTARPKGDSTHTT